jgi:hypothetical protein
MVNPDPPGRLASGKRALRLDLPIAGRSGHAPIGGTLPRVAGSAVA